MVGLSGLAGVARAQGAGEDALSFALEASRLAERFGPVAYANSLFESGTLALELNREVGIGLLRKAATEFDRLGFEGGVARAVVTLLAAGESVSRERLGGIFQTLIDPRYAEEMSQNASWLVAACLKLLADLPPDCRDCVGRYSLRHPALSVQALESSLTEDEQEILLGQLERLAPLGSQELSDFYCHSPIESFRHRGLALKDSFIGGVAESLVRVRSFGLFEVFVDEVPISEKDWKTRKVKYLVAMLASEWGTLFSEDKIMDAFWPGDRSKGKKNLYWGTTVARRCLTRHKPRLEILERREETLRLNPQFPRHHDLEEFERSYRLGCAAEGTGDLLEARLHYRRLGQFCQSEYLEGIYFDWAVRRRGFIEQTAQDGLSRLAECSLRQGDPKESIEASTRVLEFDNCRQESHLTVMKAYLQLNQPELAIEQFQSCERNLKREYGIEPSTPLIEYYHRARLAVPE